MNINPRPCVECTHYVKPSWFTWMFAWSQFIELCSHPLSKDPVDGGPQPCRTMRIIQCDGTPHTRFTAKTAAKHWIRLRAEGP